MFETVKSILGSPFYENEQCLIYNMDCEEGLKKLGGLVEINATITSPPYNIGKEYEDIQPVNNYVDWLSNIGNLIHEITHPNGSFILNVGYLKVEGKGRAVPIPYLIWDKIRFYLNQEIVWNYEAGVACKNYLSPRNEKLLWYIKTPGNYTFNLDPIRDRDVKYPNQKKNGKLRCNTIGKNPSDVWRIAKVTSGTDRASEERTEHPSQFPEDLITKAVLGFTNEEDVILDPFMGSGTTAKVALLNNRKCIGFEISKKYCQTMKERLDETVKGLNIKRMAPTLF